MLRLGELSLCKAGRIGHLEAGDGKAQAGKNGYAHPAQSDLAAELQGENVGDAVAVAVHVEQVRSGQGQEQKRDQNPAKN